MFTPPPAHVLPLVPPSLPSKQRQSTLNGYSLSTHIFPAAYLRSSPDQSLPSPPPPDGSMTKEERGKIVSACESALRQLVLARDAQFPMTNGMDPHGHPKVLWLCLDRYVKNDPVNRGLTLFFAHANGFHKEIWVPTLSSLDVDAEEIWIWDAVNHGDSALLNAGKLNSLFHWEDAVHDLLNFLSFYLPTQIIQHLPTHLARVDPLETQRRISSGFNQRTLVAVGHSFGGCTGLLAAREHPALFSSLILVDPVIIRPLWYSSSANMENLVAGRARTTRINTLALGALARRSTWSSRSNALDKFVLSPFFQSWDPAVLSLYTECGLVDDSDGGVRLKTDPLQEAILFVETPGGSEKAWLEVSNVDPKTEICWIVPDEAKPQLDREPGSTLERISRRPENSSFVAIQGAGHLIPQEAPHALAQEISKFIRGKYMNELRASL